MPREGWRDRLHRVIVRLLGSRGGGAWRSCCAQRWLGVAHELRRACGGVRLGPGAVWVARAAGDVSARGGTGGIMQPPPVHLLHAGDCRRRRRRPRRQAGRWRSGSCRRCHSCWRGGVSGAGGVGNYFGLRLQMAHACEAAGKVGSQHVVWATFCEVDVVALGRLVAAVDLQGAFAEFLI